MENINDNVDEVVGGENTTPETKENETENVVEETTAEVVVEETAVEAGSAEEKTVETVAEDTVTEETVVETETEETVAEDIVTEETVAEVSAAEATTEESVAETSETVEATETETTAESAAETVSEATEATAETVTEATEAAAETSVEDSVEEVTPVKKDSDLPRRIKIGVIVAGGIFIVGALAYAVAFMGGKTSNIVAETEVTKALEKLEETEEAIPSPEVTEEVAQVEEKEIVEDDPDSLVNIVNGNRKYDSCEYADAGVIIVKSDDKYGATNYKGQELVGCKYEEISLLPNKEGYFVLSNSKTETVTEETDGSTLTYEMTVTDYALFDNEGKAVYEGNSAVIPTGDFYILNVVDEKDARKNRTEYYKMSDTSKPVLTLYTNGEFVNATFKDGVMAVYGFEKPTTEQDDINPEKVKYGLMDEKGKVSWYKAPGVDAFKEERAEWEKLNKNNIDKLVTPGVTPGMDENNNPEENSDTDEQVEPEENPIVETETVESTESMDLVATVNASNTNVSEEKNEETSESENDDAQVTPGVSDDILAKEDNGPKYKMGRILNTPNQGYFMYVDEENSPLVMSMYTEKGEWYADIDLENMKGDVKTGFVVEKGAGLRNQLSPYKFDGAEFYNYGTEFIVQIGEKYVLCDMAKAKGMTSDKLANSIVLGTYDYASLGESVFWITYADKKYTYIEHNGKATNHVFEDATQFDYGYATVVEKGVARIISDSFEDIQELEETTTTLVNGDLFEIVINGKSRYYILAEKKKNPTADLEEETKPEDGAGAGAESGKKKKK